MQLQLFFAAKRDHHADGHQATGMTWQSGTGPYLTPRITRDQVLKFTIKFVEIGLRTIDMCLPQHGAAYRHPLIKTFAVIHLRHPLLAAVKNPARAA